MKLKEIYPLFDELAPKRYSDEFCDKYGAYDNSGILVNTGDEITGVLFALDLTRKAIETAVEKGYNLIVTHHPAIYAKLGALEEDQPSGNILRCIKHGISVVSMHLNLDVAKGGIDESLSCAVAECVGATKRNEKGMLNFSDDGVYYGRVYKLSKEVSLESLRENLTKTLQAKSVYGFGESEKPVSCVASFCGAGADEDAIDFAYQNGADTVVSSDFKHHVILSALEKGMRIIAPTHYATENYGFQKYY